MSSEAPRILVVDDHPDIREPLAAYLRRHGLDVRTAADGACLRAQLAQQAFSLIVLDVMLPDEDGLSLCTFATRTYGTPVILLTAKAATPDRIAGLQIGADDYVVKPFDPGELLARIQAVLRRAGSPSAAPGGRFQLAKWVLDAGRRELRDACGAQVALSDSEFQLLFVLAAHANQVLSRDRLLDLMQRNNQQVFDRAIDTQISRLRRKLEDDPRRPGLIKTAWGNGYTLVGDVRPL